MVEDESPIASRRQINNERHVKYRARQSSEARRQANTEFLRMRCQQETTEQSEARHLIACFMNVKVKLSSFYQAVNF